MRARFFATGTPVEGAPVPEPRLVGEAVWDGRRAVVASPDEEVRRAIERVFRPAPVVVDDPATLPRGTSGPTEFQPGTAEWFAAAARVRGAELGLSVRMVPDQADTRGWDPAGQYRPLRPAAGVASSD